MRSMTTRARSAVARLRLAVSAALLLLLVIGVAGSQAVQVPVMRSAVDVGNRVHFNVVTDPAHPVFGRFAFGKAGAGVFWGSGATVVANGDGTYDVAFVGQGWRDAAAVVDVLQGVHSYTGAAAPADLDLAVHLGSADGAGTGRLIVGGTTYQLATVGANVPSPDPMIETVLAALEASDWATVYAHYLPEFQEAMSQSTFAAEMQQRLSGFGTIVDVVPTGATTQHDAVAWQAAARAFDFHFDFGGQTTVRPSRLVLMYADGQWRIYGVDPIGPPPPDTFPPVSSAGPLNATYTTASVQVPFTASDNRSGISNVELWWRYRPTPTGTWTTYALGPTGAVSPLTFNFSAGFGYYEFYTIAIDGAANREAAPASADASTQRVDPSGWSASVRVNDDAGTADQLSPAVAVGPDGSAYAVWRDGRGPTNDIYFSKRNASTGIWGANERVNDVTTGAQTYPAVAADTNGNAYATWTDTRDGRNDIYYSKRSAATGTWSASVRVHSDTAFSDQTRPDIAVSSTGEVIIVWYRLTSNNKPGIYSARLPAGSSTWGAPVKVTTSTASKDNADIVIGSNGTAYAVWEEPTSGNGDIWFATLTSGAAAWSANTKISDDPGTAPQFQPSIGVDTAGNLTVIWSDWRTASHEVRARKRAAGSTTWAPSVVVSNAGSAGANLPQLAVRGDGVGYVVWYDGINALITNVWGSQLAPANFTWSSPEKLNDTGAAQSATEPTVGIGPSQIVVAWRDRQQVNNVNFYDIRARAKPN
jgi:hypothetical protein